MTLKEAMAARHTVRKYTDTQIPADIENKLRARIKELNKEYGLSIELSTGNTEGFNVLAKMISKNVNNYFVLAGVEGKDVDEKLGYCGSELCLFAQTLGLNTWWIGGMFSKDRSLKQLTDAGDSKVNSIIAVGYGAVQGTMHKSKKAESVASYDGEWPEWFKKGVEALLLAPTAVNRQAYTVKGKGNKVSISYAAGPFSGVDLGIGKHHFELGAGKENFEWA